MLALAASFQCLKVICGRNAEIVQVICIINHSQLVATLGKVKHAMASVLRLRPLNLDNLSRKFILFLNNSIRGFTVKIMQVGDLKHHFSDALKKIQNGEDIIISFGKKKENVAVLISIDKFKTKYNRQLGLLKNRGSFKLMDDFKISDDELLGL